MGELIGEFTLDLQRYVGNVVGGGNSRATRAFGTAIDRFKVQLNLSSRDALTFISGTDGTQVFFLNTITASVHSQEITPLPAGEFERRNYLTIRLPEYQAAAVTAVNRLVRCFKYLLRQPSLREIYFPEIASSSLQFSSPQWRYSSADVDEKLFFPAVGLPLIGIPGLGLLTHTHWGMRRVDDSTHAEIAQTLAHEVTPLLHEEILSDAQSAAVADHVRRTVLELAVACEIAVKRAFFAVGSPAAAAFDYMEDKGRTSVKVIELIDAAAVAAFGESFKDVEPAHYKTVDYLFRCRNKVAHRGLPEFRDDSGVLHTVNQEVLKDWWFAIDALLKWLAQKC